MMALCYAVAPEHRIAAAGPEKPKIKPTFSTQQADKAKNQEASSRPGISRAPSRSSAAFEFGVHKACPADAIPITTRWVKDEIVRSQGGSPIPADWTARLTVRGKKYCFTENVILDQQFIEQTYAEVARRSGLEARVHLISFRAPEIEVDLNGYEFSFYGASACGNILGPFSRISAFRNASFDQAIVRNGTIRNLCTSLVSTRAAGVSLGNYEGDGPDDQQIIGIRFAGVMGIDAYFTDNLGIASNTFEASRVALRVEFGGNTEIKRNRFELASAGGTPIEIYGGFALIGDNTFTSQYVLTDGTPIPGGAAMLLGFGEAEVRNNRIYDYWIGVLAGGGAPYQRSVYDNNSFCNVPLPFEVNAQPVPLTGPAARGGPTIGSGNRIRC